MYVGNKSYIIRRTHRGTDEMIDGQITDPYKIKLVSFVGKSSQKRCFKQRILLSGNNSFRDLNDIQMNLKVKNPQPLKNVPLHINSF